MSNTFSYSNALLFVVLYLYTSIFALLGVGMEVWRASKEEYGREPSSGIMKIYLPFVVLVGAFVMFLFLKWTNL